MANEKRFVLFPAREKKQEKSPDMTGEIMIDGKIYYLSAWTQEKNGMRYLSGVVGQEKAKPTEPAAPAERKPEPVEPNDDLPF